LHDTPSFNLSYFIRIPSGCKQKDVLQKTAVCGKITKNTEKRNTMRYVSHSPEETERLGEQLAKQLHAGDVIAFYGDLGAGKTAFTRGLARGLGISEPVTSPTYTIVNEYLGGNMPLFHFDMYRLGSADELFDIGWEDYLERGGICAVEWSEHVEEALEGAVRVSICRMDDTGREILIEGVAL